MEARVVGVSVLEFGRSGRPRPWSIVMVLTLAAVLAERSTDTPAALTLNGSPPLQPHHRLLHHPNPVYGGNDTSYTTYTHPTDPLNSSDLDGKWKKPKWVNWRNAKRVAQ